VFLPDLVNPRLEMIPSCLPPAMAFTSPRDTASLRECSRSVRPPKTAVSLYRRIVLPVSMLKHRLPTLQAT